MPLWWAGSGFVLLPPISRLSSEIPPSGDHVVTKNGARNAALTRPEEKLSGPERPFRQNHEEGSRCPGA